MQFLLIYLREAHPVDGWWLGGGMMAGMLELSGSKAASDIYDPTSMGERRAVAERCQAELEYGMPTLVDEMDDAVSEAYAARPTRLYLVGVDGRVAYAGKPGPRGFKPAELAAAIEEYLAAQTQATP